MFISKYTPLEDLSTINDGDPLSISKDIALDKNYLEYLASSFPNSSITILSGYDNFYSSFSSLYNEEETVTLAENANYINKKFGRVLTFDKEFSINQAITASRKINDVVKEINDLRFKNKPLSPFEKFVLAYRFVTDRLYKAEEEGESSSDSRNLISVLNGDKIVCTGYSNLLAVVLNRLDIPCTTQCIIAYDKSLNAYGNHATCIVRITDPKYNIDGIYFSDPTYDSARENIFGHRHTSFNGALTKLDDVQKIFSKPIILNRGLYKPDIKKFSQLEESSVKMDLILANLFPEKSMGKPQNILINEIADKKIKDAKIYEITSEIISNLTVQEIKEQAFNSASTFLNTSDFYFDNLNYNFNAIIEYLHYAGFKNKEIALFLDYYTSEKLEKLFINHYSTKYTSSIAENVDLMMEMENQIKQAQALIQKKKDFLLSTKTTTEKDHFSDDTLIEQTIRSILTSTIRTKILGENHTSNFYMKNINYLLLRGYSLKKIKNLLNEQLKTFSINEIFLDEFDEENNLFELSQINEQELYSGYYDQFEPLIYNKPYLKDYNQLASQARFINNKDFETALIHAIIASGSHYPEAQKIAKAMLKHTFLNSNPSNQKQ